MAARLGREVISPALALLGRGGLIHQMAKRRTIRYGARQRVALSKQADKRRRVVASRRYGDLRRSISARVASWLVRT
jgi:hypothetical protein